MKKKKVDTTKREQLVQKTGPNIYLKVIFFFRDFFERYRKIAVRDKKGPSNKLCLNRAKLCTNQINSDIYLEHIWSHNGLTPC